jgi:hypothetical protein
MPDDKNGMEVWPDFTDKKKIFISGNLTSGGFKWRFK